MGRWKFNKCGGSTPKQVPIQNSFGTTACTEYMDMELGRDLIQNSLDVNRSLMGKEEKK